MCGRYTLSSDVKTLQTRFSLKAAPQELTPRYNLAPGQNAPVIACRNGYRMGMFKWGLTPKWARDASIGARMISARAETIAEKPAYRKPFASQRCLVPADGFYEWKRAGAKARIPYHFTLKGGGPFAFAGLWDNGTFTIVTTAPNALLKPVHDRMPVILTPEGESLWLDPKSSPARLKELLLPFDPEAMRAVEVSSRVNSPKYDDPACAAPPPEPAGQRELF